MAFRSKRRRTARPARIALLAGLNLAAGWVLWSLLGSDASSEAVRAAASVEVAPTPPPPPPPSVLEGSRGAALEHDLKAIVARWMGRVEKLSAGRLHADEVRVCWHVRELGRGDAAAVGSQADRSVRPASNMKLITTAAALVLLGPDWNFDTAFEAGGPIRDGVLRGDLVVRAAGDPLFDPDAGGEVADLLEPAVRSLGRGGAGLRAIAGDLVLDERSFPTPGPGPEWPGESQRWAEYCALAGGFSANRGALTATVFPGEVGGPAHVHVAPRNHGLPDNLGVRTEAKGPLTIQMHARSSGVLVKGAIPRNVSSWSDSMAHPDPVELFGNVLVGALADGGIVLQGRVRRERDAPGGPVIAHLRSPLVRALRPINTDSTNAVADQVFLATGLAAMGEGSREAAGRATAKALRELGVSSDGLVQVDGSGLSRANRVTARQVTALLDAVLSGGGETAQLYVDSLALAGVSGTLEKRMRESPALGRVRAKTGFIGGTSALSGLARAQDETLLVFSILVEYDPTDGMNTRCFKPMQDEMCARLVEAAP